MFKGELFSLRRKNVFPEMDERVKPARPDFTYSAASATHSASHSTASRAPDRLA